MLASDAAALSAAPSLRSSPALSLASSLGSSQPGSATSANGGRRSGLGGANNWGKIKRSQRAAAMTDAFVKEGRSWKAIWRKLCRVELRAALLTVWSKVVIMVRERLYGEATSILQRALSTGPVGAPGQYARTYSKVYPLSLNPVWQQRLELPLDGGEMNENGEYDNKHAPYTALRIELWDRDRLSFDDFIGEVRVPLGTLMDGRTHTYTLELTDPEGKCAADGKLTGSVTFELNYES